MNFFGRPFDYAMLLELKREPLSPFLKKKVLDLEFKVSRKDPLNLEVELREIVILYAMGY